MIRRFAPAILMLALLGCVPETPPEPKRTNAPEPLYLPVSVVGRLMRASEIEYIPDAKGTDVWQTPAETERLKHGDCEDICIYLQDQLAQEGVHAEVVFGLKTAVSKNGHAWIEMEHDDETYVVEPRSIGVYRRSRLPRVLYIRAEDIDVVAEKIDAYHDRTGVWVNSAYRDAILKKKTP